MRAPRSERKVALVTGASRGLGRTVAEFLTAEGYSVILTARGTSDLEGVGTHLARLG